MDSYFCFSNAFKTLREFQKVGFVFIALFRVFKINVITVFLELFLSNILKQYFFSMFYKISDNIFILESNLRFLIILSSFRKKNQYSLFSCFLNTIVIHQVINVFIGHFYEIFHIFFDIIFVKKFALLFKFRILSTMSFWHVHWGSHCLSVVLGLWSKI